MPTAIPPLIDGHLDLAMNAMLYERDITLPLNDIRAREQGMTASEPGVCTVTLPELRRAGVRVVMGTLIARVKQGVPPQRLPSRHDIDWPTPDMAEAAVMSQFAYYLRLQRRGEITLIGSAQELQQHWTSQNASIGVVLLMEGADPIAHPEELPGWVDLGLRAIGLAHYGTARYAHGTPNASNPNDPLAHDGPLTDAGRALLDAMAEFQLLLDLSHLSDLSFGEAVERYNGPVCVSHAACRALSDSPRQITDEQIRAVASKAGVVGIPIHNGMLAGAADLSAPTPRDQVRCSTIAQHIDHVCQLTGSDVHAAIGSDLDGGYGRDSIPRDLETIADLPKLADALHDQGYDDAAIGRVLGGNWLNLLTRVLQPFDAPDPE